MKKRRRRTMAATELRIHLGAALRSLDRGEIVIEKGGIPVAVLSRYTPIGSPESLDEAYERALSQRGDPSALARWLADEERGSPSFDADEMKANIRKWREEGASDRYYEFTETGAIVRHGREHRPAQRRRRKGG